MGKNFKNLFSALALVTCSLMMNGEAQAKKSTEGQTKVRQPASQEEGKCYANIGIVGTLKGVIRESEEILYLKDCLKHSESDAIFEIPSTFPGAVPRHFIAKVKAKEIPFFFRMGSFTYHIFEGTIIGVTRANP